MLADLADPLRRLVFFNSARARPVRRCDHSSVQPERNQRDLYTCDAVSAGSSGGGGRLAFGWPGPDQLLCRSKSFHLRGVHHQYQREPGLYEHSQLGPACQTSYPVRSAVLGHQSCNSSDSLKCVLLASPKLACVLEWKPEFYRLCWRPIFSFERDLYAF